MMVYKAYWYQFLLMDMCLSIYQDICVCQMISRFAGPYEVSKKRFPETPKGKVGYVVIGLAFKNW